MKAHRSFVIGLVMIVSIACSKEDTSTFSSTTPTPKTDPIQELSRSWMVQSLTGSFGASKVYTLYTRGSSTSLLDYSKQRLNLTNSGDYEFIGPTGDVNGKGKWSLANNNTQLILTDSTNPVASMTFTLNSFSAAGLYVTYHANETLLGQLAGVDTQGASQADYAFSYVPAK